MSIPRPPIAARKPSTRTNNVYQIMTMDPSPDAAGAAAAASAAAAEPWSLGSSFAGLKLVRWWMIAVLSGVALALYSQAPGDPFQAATKAAVMALWS